MKNIYMKTLSITNAELEGLLFGLDKFKQDGVKLPGAAAISLIRNVRNLTAARQPFEKAKQEIIKKHGEQVGETTDYNIKEENIEAYNEDITKLYNESVDVQVLLIKADQLDSTLLNIDDALTLEFMIE